MSKTGLVLISHSPDVVQGIKNIIRQVNEDTGIALAGGTDDNEIGTSIEKIVRAIDEAATDHGTVLLYDLGSARMNAEMAIEMTTQENVHLAEAPLLEGAYVAAVESGMGKSPEAITHTLTQEFPQKSR